MHSNDTTRTTKRTTITDTSNYTKRPRHNNNNNHHPPSGPLPTTPHDNTTRHTIPFKGNYKGCSCNLEALMAVRTSRQTAKCNMLKRLMATHDYGTFQETHGTLGKEEAFSIPQGLVGFWSHLSAQKAGVGIILKQSFLDKFATVQKGDFQELEPGRVARLRLRGPEGHLDIWTIYLTTGEGTTADLRARNHSHSIIRANLAPRDRVLSLLSGDWNYVVSNQDRWSCASKQWSGHSDHNESTTVTDEVFTPAGLHELYQEGHTYFSSIATSRLDRIYSNHHQSEQLDHKFGCSTLPRDPNATSHVPISFFRYKPTCAYNVDNNEHKQHTVNNSTINHPDWPKRVAAELGNISVEPNDYNNPLRKMVLTKRAMHTVSYNMIHEQTFAPADTNEDKLSCTLSFARAAQASSLTKMYRKYLEYPHIGTFVDPRDPNACYSTGFQKMLDHAVTLAKQNITEELQDIQRQCKEDNNNYKTTTRKNNVLAHLKRLTPGSCTTIGAIETIDGTYATDPDSIAKELAAHWSRTFKRKPINRHLLSEWLRATLQPHASTPTSTTTPAPTTTHPTTPPPLSPPHHATTTTRPAPLGPGTTGPHSRPKPNRTPLPTNERHWRIRRKDVEKAIRFSGNSSPGPDGIPFKAWRALGPLGISILFDVANTLEQPNGAESFPGAYFDEDQSHPHHFNASTLVCLAKKSSSTTPDGVKAYVPANTRPLNIVNCDNRIIASAARNRWEEHLAKWIKPRQQGFLPGRSILANLLDLDTASMITSLTHEDGACILLDFASAFPSISQEFLLETLSAIGLPPRSMNFLHAIYSESYCNIQHANTTAGGFNLEAGVRQGCPLSPLLYATIAEVLLDRIEAECPNTMVRAYADDTALVLNDFGEEAPILQRIITEFGSISGLHLNTGKCITIPLGPQSLEAFKAHRDNVVPAWIDMPVADKGKYLGFYVGPGKGESSWTEPSSKYLERCRLWGDQGLGLHYHTVAYNTFAVSTLSYISQLEEVPQQVKELEKEGLKKAIKGPNKWAEPEDLWSLKEHYGQTASCRSIGHTAKAAQLRVRTWDPACKAWHFRQDSRDLKLALSSPNQLYNRARWDDWYSRSFALTLDNNKAEFKRNICSTDDLCGRPGNSSTQLHNPRTHFQRKAYDKLLAHGTQHPTQRTRHKFIRWELHNPATHPPPEGTTVRHNTPAWQSRRALAHLQLLPKLVPPRVCAATFSTLWNRWCTHRRYQNRQAATNKCLLGCSATAEDSIEHYCQCPITKEVIRRNLNMDPKLYANLHTFLLCNTHIHTKDELASIALLMYAVYSATNHFRHNPPAPNVNIYEAVSQWLREGAKHHNAATQTLDNRWNPNRQSNNVPPIPLHI